MTTVEARKCRFEGCAGKPVRGTYVCADHLDVRTQCVARVRVIEKSTGEVLEIRQCKHVALQGTTRCSRHAVGGQRGVAERTKAVSAMRRYVTPYGGEIDPLSAFEMEFRRTYGRILWLENQIGSLESEQDLIWGKTKEELTTVGEFPGTTTTYEARVHLFEQLLQWERKHLLELQKVWIGAKFEENKLALMRSQIDYTFTLVRKAVEVLGFDPDAPDVRDKILRLFERELETESSKAPELEG